MKKILIIALLLSLISCAPLTKDQFVARQQRFMDEVEQQHLYFNDQDWEAHNQELNLLLNEYYPRFKDEMSVQEKVELWGDVVAYHLMQAGDRGEKHWLAHEEEYLQLLEENAYLLEDAGRIFEQEVLPELERTLPELERLGRDFLDRLEKQGTLDRLEDRLDEWEDSMEIHMKKE